MPYTCPECRQFGWTEETATHRHGCTVGAKKAESKDSVGIPVEQAVVEIAPSPPLPTRKWGRILDDISEFIAATLSADFDTVAAYLAVDKYGRDVLLIACNSDTKISFAMAPQRGTFVATSGPSEFNKPVAAPNIDDIGHLPVTDDERRPASRQEAGLQSLARLIEAQRRPGIYSDQAKLDRIMAAIRNGNVKQVPACRNREEMHAEIKLFNYVRLNAMTPAFAADDCIGTSKPMCPICHSFFKWLEKNPLPYAPRIGVDRFHGLVGRRWTAPIMEKPQSEKLALFIQSECKLRRDILVFGERCYVCRSPHAIFNTNVEGDGRSSLNVGEDIGATDDVVRSRSPTRSMMGNLKD